MPRKLKVYVTSIGFFDLAIAAPSMKAALSAWGADSNLFHQNFAKEVTDPSIVKAAMAHPGVVLKRPVGSTKPFAETSELPEDLVSSNRRTEHRQRPQKETRSSKAPGVDPRKVAAAYDREERKRQAQDRREEAKREAARQKREAAVAKAEVVLRQAEAEHQEFMSAIEAERERLDRRAQAERDRWVAAERKLGAAIRKARTG